MAWNTASSYSSGTSVTAAFCGGVGLDLRIWGGNVDGGGYTLSGVLIATTTGVNGQIVASIRHTGNGIASAGTVLKVSNSYATSGGSGSYEVLGCYANNFGASLLSVADTGKVGIGIFPALARLHISATTAQEMRMSGPATPVTATEMGRVSFGPGALTPGAYILGSSDDYGGTYGAGELQFWTGDASNAATKRMSISKTGNVGIGKAPTTTSRLCISGLPTSSSGLAPGDLWLNSNVLTIVP